MKTYRLSLLTLVLGVAAAAPAWLTTAIGCFSTRDATWQIERIDWSAVPPAGHGQMKVIGRAG